MCISNPSVNQSKKFCSTQSENFSFKSKQNLLNLCDCDFVVIKIKSGQNINLAQLKLTFDLLQ